MDSSEKDPGRLVRHIDLCFLSLLTFPKSFQLVVAYQFHVPCLDLLLLTTCNSYEWLLSWLNRVGQFWSVIPLTLLYWWTFPYPTLWFVSIPWSSTLGVKLGFPSCSEVKNSPANAVQSLGWEDPLRRKWQPTPVFLPGKSHWQRSLMGYSLWDHKIVEHDLTTNQQ